MFTVTPAQFRAARAMLNWTLMDFSRASGLGVATLSRLENGLPNLCSYRSMLRAQEVLEAKGIEFLADDEAGVGVRLVLKYSSSIAWSPRNVLTSRTKA